MSNDQDRSPTATGGTDHSERNDKALLDQTVRSEIDLTLEREKALQDLDAQWKKERDALAHKPTHELSFDIGGVSTRSIQNEYTQRREQHNQRRDAIERDFANNREILRNDGNTISDEFDKSRLTQSDNSDELTHRFNNDQDRGRSR